MTLVWNTESEVPAVYPRGNILLQWGYMGLDLK